MSFKITYRPLVRIDFIHDYFRNMRDTHYLDLSVEERKIIDANYDVREWFDIVPCPSTKLLMLNHRMVYKTTNKGVLVYIASKLEDANTNTYKAFINPEGTDKLNFQLYLKDGLFTNYTNLPEFEGNNELFYFTNIDRVNNEFPYLSSRITKYNPSGPSPLIMKRGDLILNNSNVTYEARVNVNATVNPNSVNPSIPFYQADTWRRIRPDGNTSNGPHDIGEIVSNGGRKKFYQVKVDGTTSGALNSSDYELIAKLPISYTSDKNIQKIYSRKINYQFANAPASNNELKVIVTNDLTPIPITEFTFEVDDNGLGEIDLSRLPDGLYNLSISDDSSSENIKGYFIGENPWKKPFGVAEIVIRPRISNYTLIDSAGVLREPKFEVHFLNRYTKWQYFNAKNQVLLKEEDLTLPITKFGYLEVSHEGIPLPNPDARMVKPEDNIIYSEIFVNV